MIISKEKVIKSQIVKYFDTFIFWVLHRNNCQKKKELSINFEIIDLLVYNVFQEKKNLSTKNNNKNNKKTLNGRKYKMLLTLNHKKHAYNKSSKIKYFYNFQ